MVCPRVREGTTLGFIDSVKSIHKKGVVVTQPVKQSAGSEAPVVIGQGMIIKGSLHSENDVFLDGEIEGDLNVENCSLLIGPHGKVVANVRAREVDIHGIMTGN